MVKFELTTTQSNFQHNNLFTFANHGLHFKFDVQRVNNIVNQLKIKTCGWWTFKHNLHPTLGRHNTLQGKC